MTYIQNIPLKKSPTVLSCLPDSIKLPFVMDQNHDSVTVVVDGKTYTITYGKRK